jgi:hypothetical protein
MSSNEPITTSSIAQRNLTVVEIQNRGDMKEALATALETEQLAVTHLPSNDTERAKAIYNLGAIQTGCGDRNGFETLDRALEAMSAAVGEQHPYYGRLLGLIASRHVSFGNIAAAELFYVKALAVLSTAENSSYCDEVVWDLTRLHSAMSLSEPADASRESEAPPKIGEAHFERSLQTQAMREELDQLPSEIRDLAEKNLAGARQVFGKMSTHEAAQVIIKDRETRGEPFALLLRGFEGEAYDYVINLGPKLSGWAGLGELYQHATDPASINNDPDRKTVVTRTGEPNRLERILAGALGSKLKALTVASPASIDPGQTVQGAVLPRLILPNESWLSIVRSLIRVAHLIVVDGLGLNQGVRLELETIVECGKCDNTVIVLHRDRSEFDKIEDTAKVMADLAGGTLESSLHREWLTNEHPILAPFMRIGYIEDLSNDNLASSPLFSTLVATTPLARSVTRLAKTGTALVESGNVVDGALYLEVSILLALGIPGWAERATVCFNLGTLYRAAGQPEGALQAFTGCHTVAVSTNDLSNQGRSLAMIGDIYLNTGKTSEARETLVKSLIPLEVMKDTEYIERSLRNLAEACKVLCEEAGAAASLTELKRLQIEGSWSRSQAAKLFVDLFFTP